MVHAKGMTVSSKFAVETIQFSHLLASLVMSQQISLGESGT